MSTAARMPQPGKPFSPTPDFAGNKPVALPDLLAGLMNNASLGPVVPDPEVLTPEIMAPEEPMPPATPVNKAMPEFLDSLRTLLNSYEDDSARPSLDVPSAAVQDFAHGTNELLNYLLHEVVGAAAAAPAAHSPGAVQDFAEATNELLNYLLEQVAEPQVDDETIYTAESLADFAAGTQDLLHELLAMSDQAELAGPAVMPAPEAAAPLDYLLSDLLQTLPEPPPEEPVTDTADQDLLVGLLANLAPPPPEVHDLGEVPREYIDESDKEVVERPAGPFEMLLDAIDAEMPPPPAVRGVLQLAQAVGVQDARFVAFELGAESYALPFASVIETDHVSKWTHVPGMPAHLRGVLNLRGEIIPLVDLRLLFAVAVPAGAGRMLVVRDTAGKSTMAFVVDRLLGLVAITTSEIREIRQSGVLRGFATASGRQVGLLDADQVIAAAHGDGAILPHHVEEQSYV